MFLADSWNDYEILDAGGGNKLERWGGVTLLRPDPLAAWPMGEKGAAFAPDGTYIRSSSGGGHWEFARQLPESWRIRWRELTFIVRPTGFKHTGLFPEQAANWDWLRAAAGNEPCRALNLFAYTGGATLALASAGAEVVHVDAAKGMTAWAKDNLAASGLGEKPVRFIVDDAMKFAKREERRGRLYDGIVMDPPSYGRGPDGEMWKIEEDLYPLVEQCAKLLSERPRFFLINTYTTGLSPTVLKNILVRAMGGRGSVDAGEVCLPIGGAQSGLVLPCGSTARWSPDVKTN